MPDGAAIKDCDPLALAMLAAWVNVPVDKLPAEMRAPSCKHTMAAWKRVGEAALAWHCNAGAIVDVAK